MKKTISEEYLMFLIAYLSFLLLHIRRLCTDVSDPKATEEEVEDLADSDSPLHLLVPSHCHRERDAACGYVSKMP